MQLVNRLNFNNTRGDIFCWSDRRGEGLAAGSDFRCLFRCGAKEMVKMLSYQQG